MLEASSNSNSCIYNYFCHTSPVTQRSRIKTTKIAETISESCVGMRARRLDREVTRIFDTHLAPLGLTGPQLTLLVAIHLEAPALASGLAERLALDKSTVSRNLTLMENQGWISREKEGVRQLLELTAEGRALLLSAEKPWQAAQHATLELLGGEIVESLSASDCAFPS